MTLAVNEINKYIFSRPDIYSIFDGSPTPFTNAFDAPVYPVNEIPESDSPFTVYLWRTRKSQSHFTLNIDEITYSIWDSNIARLQEYEAKLRKYLGQEDESANAFNQWAMNNGQAKIVVHWIKYMGSTDAFPEKQEGGKIGKNLTFSIQYIDCDSYSPLITT